MPRCRKCFDFTPITVLEGDLPYCKAHGREHSYLCSDDLLEDGPLTVVPSIRPAQLQMAHLVEVALLTKSNAMAEAGVGTGKTYAYLVPALGAGKRVVISTENKNLLDQVTDKDAPVVAEVFKRFGQEKKIVAMKGASNYGCFLKWFKFRVKTREKGGPAAEDRVRVNAWFKDSTYAEFRELDPPIAFAQDIDASSCIGKSCPHFDGCGFRTNRIDARAADCVITTHYTIASEARISGPATQHPLLGDYDIFIADEAHKLEEVFTSIFGSSVNDKRLLYLHQQAAQTCDSPFYSLNYERAECAEEELKAAVAFAGWDSDKPHVLMGTHLQKVQKNLLGVLHSMSQASAEILSRHASLEEKAKQKELNEDTYEELMSLSPYIKKYRSLRRSISDLCAQENEFSVTYWEKTSFGQTLLKKPLRVNNILKQTLYANKSSVVLTSATLATNGSFQNAQADLGLPIENPTRNTLVVPSPFNYARQCISYFEADPALCPPKVGGDKALRTYHMAITRRIREFAKLTGGFIFVLFTNNKDLFAVSELLSNGINDVFPQNTKLESAKQTLKRYLDASYKERVREPDVTKRSGPILLGVDSFWSGVSVPGPDLLCVIIPKAPFPVPTDPVYQKKSALLQSKGINPWPRLVDPYTITRLKQGSGRLIRTQNDLGIFAFLDGRRANSWKGGAWKQGGWRKDPTLDLPVCVNRTEDFASVQTWWGTKTRELQALEGGWVSAGCAPPDGVEVLEEEVA